MRFHTMVVVLAWLMCCPYTNLSAQDIHFSQMDMVPSFENASNTGRFLGSIRAGGLYRSQWSGVDAGQFKTSLFHVDAPISVGFGDKDWFGLGLMIYQDQSGSVQLSNGGVYLGGAYHFSLDHRRDHVISMGVQVGFAQRRLKNGFAAEFLDELENIDLVSADRALLSNNRRNFADINLGVQVKTKLVQNLETRLGVQIRHINSPESSLYMDDPYQMNKMLILHGRLEYLAGSSWSISPSYYHYRTDSDQADIATIDIRYLLKPASQVYLIGSVGTRLGDANIFAIGLDYKKLTAKLSYDLTSSDLSNINGANSLEISAYYTFKLKRKPNIKPTIFCPRF